MTFDRVKDFLESWGLHFETNDEECSTTIPWPQVYSRMCDDAIKVGGMELRSFIGHITDTMEGKTYLAYGDWEEIEEQWDNRPTAAL